MAMVGHNIKSASFNCYYYDSVPSSNVTYTPHFGWATLMLLAFLLGYLICWYVWLTTDKGTPSPGLLLFSFYSQYVAFNIIWKVWTHPKRGKTWTKIWSR